MKLAFIDLTAELVCKNINGPEAAVMPGIFVLLAGISQTNDQPAFAGSSATEHCLEQVSDGGATVDMGDGSCKHGCNIQLLDLLAGAVSGNGNGVVHNQFLQHAGLNTV